MTKLIKGLKLAFILYYSGVGQSGVPGGLITLTGVRYRSARDVRNPQVSGSNPLPAILLILRKLFQFYFQSGRFSNEMRNIPPASVSSEATWF